ncbi:MAG: hypothetical protein HXX12_03615 [Geothrix sp.]|uniref:hypothetical protein n=1 Tax=Geothrix sp. TaxID=1962974 RepID=UPI0017D5D4E5|nr:hypothetical protein [Geothrix sp.]NWJ40044.1 hypothetical protein [Geothrix sp.]WIL21947.1 MAG: hypothetical protein QOZ81_001227 [Geothrix sp.]
MPFQPAYTDEQFWELYKKFNSLFGDYWKWGDHEARKNHMDEFDNEVQRGEVYFTRDCGGAWNDKFKMSRKSMEIILMILFSENHRLNQISDHLLESEAQEMRAAMERVSKAMGFPSP